MTIVYLLNAILVLNYCCNVQGEHSSKGNASVSMVNNLQKNIRCTEEIANYRDNFGSMIKALYGTDLTNQTEIISMFGLDDMYRDHVADTKIRYKRQAGGKYTEAASMGQTKCFRLQLQMFKNPFTANYVAGPHPLHPLIPQAFVDLLRLKIVEYFSPDITKPAKIPTNASLLFITYKDVLKGDQENIWNKNTMLASKERVKRQNTASTKRKKPDNMELATLTQQRMAHMMFEVLSKFAGATSLGQKYFGGKPLDAEMTKPILYLKNKIHSVIRKLEVEASTSGSEKRR